MFLKNIAMPSTLVLLLTTVSSAAHARFFWEKPEAPQRNTYISAAYGSFNTDGEDLKDDDRYHEVGIGAKLSKHFGVEGVYTSFGTVSNDVVEANLDGFSANIVGYFPLASYLDVYLKGGIFFANFSLKSGDYSKSFKDEQPSFALGLNAKVSDPLTLFLEISHFSASVEKDDLNDTLTQTDYDFGTLKVGAKYTF